MTDFTKIQREVAEPIGRQVYAAAEFEYDPLASCKEAAYKGAKAYHQRLVEEGVIPPQEDRDDG